MKRWIPVAVFLLATAAITAGAALTLDRGPFERTVYGAESIYWDAAVRIAGGEAAEGQVGALPSPLYPQFLSALASEEMGAVRRARTILAAILIPLAAVPVSYTHLTLPTN